jgi:HAD superfamily hydrolase (TIGR01549 family)
MHALEIGRVHGIVFDLWNTLAFNDHRPNPIIALAQAFRVLGQPGWTKVIERGMMMRRLPGIREGVASLSQATGVTLTPEETESLCGLWRNACARTRLFEDVPAALAALAPRFRLGLLSNTQSFDLEFLEDARLAPRFDARALSCDEGLLKPDPALFLRIAERLSLDPAQLLMVGDNLNDDVLASESVGMQALLVRRHEAPLSFQEQRPDREALHDLAPLLSAFGG